MNDNVTLDFGTFNFGEESTEDLLSKSNPLISQDDQEKKDTTIEPTPIDLEKGTENVEPIANPNNIQINLGNEDPDNKDSKDLENKDDKSSEVVKGYIDFSKQNDILLLDEGFEIDGSEESIQQAKEQTVRNYQRSAVNAILSKLPQRLQDMAIYALKGGTDFDSFEKGTSEELNIDTLEGQTNTLKTYYKNVLQWDSNKIEKYLSRLDENDVAEEATDLKSKLETLEIKQRQDKIKEQEEEDKNRTLKLQEFNNRVKTNIDQAGFVPSARKTKLNNFVFNTARKEDGVMTELVRTFNTIQSNPEHFVQLADLLLDYDPQKGIAFQRFEKKGTTTMNKGLKQALEETVSSKIASMSNAGSGSKDNSSREFDWSKFEL